MRAGVPITCPEMPSTLRSQTSLLERRDSIKTTGCGQLLRVVKYAVLVEFMYYAPQTIAVSEQVPRAWGAATTAMEAPLCRTLISVR
jgi:hypothetical protein